MPDAPPITDERQIYLTADMACRLGAIDIGSNSVRLLVAEALRGGTYRILDEEREPTRLGRSASVEGRLDDESMDRTLQALRNLGVVYTQLALKSRTPEPEDRDRALTYWQMAKDLARQLNVADVQRDADREMARLRSAR